MSAATRASRTATARVTQTARHIEPRQMIDELALRPRRGHAVRSRLVTSSTNDPRARRSSRAAQVRGQLTSHAVRCWEHAWINIPSGVSSYSILSRCAVSGQVMSRDAMRREVAVIAPRPDAARVPQSLRQHLLGRRTCASSRRSGPGARGGGHPALGRSRPDVGVPVPAAAMRDQWIRAVIWRRARMSASAAASSAARARQVAGAASRASARKMSRWRTSAVGEAGVELARLRIVERAGEQAEALGGAALDHGEHEQAIEQALGLALADQVAQCGGVVVAEVVARRLTRGATSAARPGRRGGSRRARGAPSSRDEIGALGIAADQRQRRLRGLALAVQVIGVDRIEIGERDREPARIGGARAVAHRRARGPRPWRERCYSQRAS